MLLLLEALDISTYPPDLAAGEHTGGKRRVSLYLLLNTRGI
jgi:hypothetical protein